jgi:ankyrin repeat protein
MGADINAKNEQGKIVLHLKSTGYYKTVLKLLLDIRVDINMKDKDGWMALNVVSKLGHMALAQLLIDSSAEPRVERIRSSEQYHIVARYHGHQSTR